MEDPRLRVCLERAAELASVKLRLRDWPGREGPLVHLPDPFAASDDVLLRLAAWFPPRFRLVSLSPRGAAPYQVDAADLYGVLEQFGFAAPVLVGEGLGCVSALLVAAWYPDRLAGLVLIEPAFAPPTTDSLVGWALRDCPPDRDALRRRVRCPVLESPDVTEISAFLNG